MVRSTRKNRMNRNRDFWTWMQRFTNPLQLQMLKIFLRTPMPSIKGKTTTQIYNDPWVWIQHLANLLQIVESLLKIVESLLRFIFFMC